MILSVSALAEIRDLPFQHPSLNERWIDGHPLGDHRRVDRKRAVLEFDHADPLAPSRSLILSATRRALAMMVKVGFTAPIEGKKLASAR